MELEEKRVVLKAMKSRQLLQRVCHARKAVEDEDVFEPACQLVTQAFDEIVSGNSKAAESLALIGVESSDHMVRSAAELALAIARRLSGDEVESAGGVEDVLEPWESGAAPLINRPEQETLLGCMSVLVKLLCNRVDTTLEIEVATGYEGQIRVIVDALKALHHIYIVYSLDVEFRGKDRLREMPKIPDDALVFLKEDDKAWLNRFLSDQAVWLALD